jgi:hypothetical protein
VWVPCNLGRVSAERLSSVAATIFGVDLIVRAAIMESNDCDAPPPKRKSFQILLDGATTVATSAVVSNMVLNKQSFGFPPKS